MGSEKLVKELRDAIRDEWGSRICHRNQYLERICKPGRCSCESIGEAVLARLDALGYAVVPKEPTEKMLCAEHETGLGKVKLDAPYSMEYSDPADVWRAMLAAATP